MAWKLAILVHTFLAVYRFPLGKIDASFYNLTVGIWTHNWDAGNFLSIVTNGYKDLTFAFFPLLPLLTRMFSGLTGINTAIIGLLISNFAVVFGLLMLLKLLRLDYDEMTSRRSLFLLLAFPTAFFLQAFYSESLFLLLTISSFYFARKEKWLLVGLCGGFAALTRFLGVFLFVPLLTELLNRYGLVTTFREKRRELLLLFLIPLFFSLYLVFLGITTGNLYKFLSVQKDWGRISQPGQALSPIIVIQQNWENFLGGANFSGGGITKALDLIFVLGALMVLVFSVKQKMRLSYIVYGLISLSIPLSSGVLTSMARFVLVIFPLFIVLAQLAQRSFWYYFTLLLFIFLQAQFIISFVFGLWVA